ncbi:NAD(P)-binding protein [Mollisia scopiformis]|uniref:NAD(P)-binding protein n=1 Tax=Mollisia scopiformis TaxID=149040 RepID=A0A194WX06_MOLSC|nr:NAD(P)-binding protein [Mollisia scopiformis]KUJ12214.1 NAD(P)-binding protein [Mollisia scopiformis]
MSAFNKSTSGADVVAAFPEAVQGKTCKRPMSTWTWCLLTWAIVVITGPSAGGLGAQTAIFLAAGKPAEILLLGRTESKATSVMEEIQKISPSTKVSFIHLDLTRFDSIKFAAAEIKKLVSKIDVLINNAGIMGVKEYTLTPEGLESQFGSNHIGHFLLTNLLMPSIETAGRGARIVNVSSNGYQLSEVRFSDYDFDNGKAYDPWHAYGQSKTANILFTVSLASKLARKGISSFVVHPGAIYTNLGAHVEMSEWATVGKMFNDRGYPSVGINKNLAQGTSCILVAALDPSIESNYLSDCAIEETPDYAHNTELAQKLWALSEEIVGEKFQL